MPSSIAPSSRSSRPRRAIFAGLAIAAVAFATWALLDQYREFRSAGVRLRPQWSLIATSCLVVLLTHALLIETWRRVVGAWDAQLTFGAAMRIWCVSNLGKYAPGKVWAIAAMALMAQEKGVSPIAAAGSSLLINLVNVIVGTGIVAATGADFLGRRGTGLALAAVLVAILVALPRLMPGVVGLLNRVTGRSYELARLPGTALWIAAAGCAVAWVLYGVAFRLFVLGLLAEAPGSVTAYVAAYTGSYLLGYIMLFAPGGIGVRESALVETLRRLPFATAGGAGIIALSSRLWLTALEVLPGVLFLAHDSWRRRSQRMQ